MTAEDHPTDALLKKVGQKVSITDKSREKIQDTWDDAKGAISASLGARAVRTATSYTVLHAGFSALLFLALCGGVYFTYMKARKSLYSTGKKDLFLLLTGDIVLLTVLTCAFTVEVMNTVLASTESEALRTFVPVWVADGMVHDLEFIGMEAVPTKGELKELNRVLVNEGIPQDICRVDVDLYVSLQNIQNYTHLTHTGFTNACAFGLDTILGRMTSNVEHEITPDFIQKFETAVAEYDSARELFLRNSRALGLSQAKWTEYKQAFTGTDGAKAVMFADLTGAGIDDELGTSIKTISNTDIDELLSEAGATLVTKRDGLRREQQLLTLSTAPSTRSVGGVGQATDKHKKQEAKAAFKASSVSVNLHVDLALSTDVRVLATFRNMDDESLQQLTTEILLVNEMVTYVSASALNNTDIKQGRGWAMQSCLIVLTLHALAYYLITYESSSRKEPTDCKKQIAIRAGVDAEDMTSDEIEDAIGPMMRDPMNFKLRKEYARCVSESSIKQANTAMGGWLQQLVAVVVMLAVVAGIRSHFAEARTKENDINASHRELKDRMGKLVDAIDDKTKMFDPSRVRDIDTVVADLVSHKRRIPSLSSQHTETTSPRIGTVAKYAVASCLALAAVFVVFKKMRPAVQIERMRDLKAGPAPTMTGGGQQDDYVARLQRELDILQGDGTAKEVHSVVLVLMLAATSYTGYHLTAEVFT